MQISRLAAGPASPSDLNLPGGVAAATAVLNDSTGAAGLTQQLEAYQALAGRWREARNGDRAMLAQALTDSPFGQKVQSTLDAFTRAAWTGPDAVPPAPQAQILKAFDDLSDAERQIVAAMQVDTSGASAFASPADYRARLQADLDATEAAVAHERRTDTVTLSKDAQALLESGDQPDAAPAPPPAGQARTRADLAAAMAAYSRAAG
jgi:hypothetical protein